MDAFDQVLIDVVGNEHPETLEAALRLVRLKGVKVDETLMERVLRLERQGKISFNNSPAGDPSSLTGYFLSRRATWYWVVLGLVVVVSVMVFVFPEGGFPLLHARYLFGSIFVLFLPGHTLLRVLFGGKELDSIERFALSIGLSLALTSMAGLLMNCTPWGIRTTPVTFCLLVLTLIFASAAAVRDYKYSRA